MSDDSSKSSSTPPSAEPPPSREKDVAKSSADGGQQQPSTPAKKPNISKYRPVSIATGVALITVFGLYKSGKLDESKIDCSNKFLPTVARDFTHVDTMHLVFNLVALFYVSKMETQFGSIQFLALMGLIVLITALGTMAATKLFGVNCAVGFSGALLGLMAFGLTSGTEKLNWLPLVYLVAVSVIPVPGQNISISGHLIGIATGALLGLGYRATGLNQKNKSESNAAATAGNNTSFSFPGF